MVSRQEWEVAFKTRTKAARMALRPKVSQQTMGEKLGLGVGKDAQGTYKQYESRSPLPHYLVSRFCRICGINEGELFAIDVVDTQNFPREKRPIFQSSGKRLTYRRISEDQNA